MKLGKFEWDNAKNAIKIPRGTAKVIEIFGLIAGANNVMCRIDVVDENGNSLSDYSYQYQSRGILYQPAGNGYFKIPLPSNLIKIDATKDWYVKLLVQGYNTDFGINVGFGNVATFYGVKKIS